MELSLKIAQGWKERYTNNYWSKIIDKICINCYMNTFEGETKSLRWKLRHQGKPKKSDVSAMLWRRIWNEETCKDT